jgi:deazaflavin-dependent oxidoreductase (nitroreductase family)
VTLDDGVELGADLLVGADGLHSTVRRLVFGDESKFFRYLGFHTTAFTFDAQRIHTAVDGRVCLTDTVDREMGFYALRDGRVAVFAVHRTPDPALPHDIQAAVRESYGGLGWVVPEALDHCPPSDRIYYDQVAQIEMPSWSKGRVVLVGDACYAVSLIAGQGASVGMAGAYLLADQLARAQSVDHALVEYEKLWRPVAEEKQKVGRSAAPWFLPASPWQLRVRRAVLQTARLPVVDRYVASTLAGKPTALITSLRSGGSQRRTDNRTNVIRPGRPSHVLRFIFKAPVRLYNNDLGWLLGKRFLCLTHVGRRSGRRYRSVLEVIGHNPTAAEYIVIAGLGPSSDWYRDIQANPAIEVVVGRHRFAPQHRVIDETEAAAVVVDYERRNRWIIPVIRRLLTTLVGWRYDGSEIARQRLVRQLPVVAFRPRSESSSSAG